MKLGIIGLPQSGKTTVFEALTKNISESAHKGEERISTIRVPRSSEARTISYPSLPPSWLASSSSWAPTIFCPRRAKAARR